MKSIEKTSERNTSKPPLLSIVVPCFNEEKVLPVTSVFFLRKIIDLAEAGKIAAESHIIFVDDGSSDSTWKIITELSQTNGAYTGIRLSRNHGHQNAVLAGLMEAKDNSDITITVDCDGQDDIDAMDRMVDEYLSGAEIVYGVRSSRGSDSFFKRFTAESFYRLMRWLGVDTVFNHADYRLVSSKVLRAFSDFKEVNIFLRGMFPLVGFKSTCVYYERHKRIAGESHYPLRKMLHLAFDGITSLSTKPLHIIVALGCLVAFVSFVAVVWSIAVHLLGRSVSGWASTISIICFIGGIQLVCLGVIGEYVGKIYMEVKRRPRFIVSERTKGVLGHDGGGKGKTMKVNTERRKK